MEKSVKVRAWPCFPPMPEYCGPACRIRRRSGSFLEVLGKRGISLLWVFSPFRLLLVSRSTRLIHLFVPGAHRYVLRVGVCVPVDGGGHGGSALRNGPRPCPWLLVSAQVTWRGQPQRELFWGTSVLDPKPQGVPAQTATEGFPFQSKLCPSFPGYGIIAFKNNSLEG